MLLVTKNSIDNVFILLKKNFKKIFHHPPTNMLLLSTILSTWLRLKAYYFDVGIDHDMISRENLTINYKQKLLVIKFINVILNHKKIFLMIA